MKTVFKTAMIVTIFSLAEKFLGFLYRIYLSRAIGNEGIGLYQIALSVFATVLTLCSAGIPATVSRIITKYRSQGKGYKTSKVVTAGIAVTVITGVPLTILLFALPNALGFAFADERCLPLFYTILPALTINAVYGVLKGMFCGTKDFLPYSVIELIEEAVMIVCGIILVQTATSAVDGATKAIIAVFVSYAVSFTLGTGLFIYRGGKIKNPKGELKPLFFASLPITAMRTASSMVASLISILLPIRLIASGMSKSGATASFGAFYGLAMPLLYAPMSLIGPFTVVLIPQIAESFYKKDFNSLKTDIEKSLNITIFLTALAIPAFTCFGEEVGIMIFDSYEGGIYTSRSAILMMLICLSSLTTSVLNSIGQENKTFLTFTLSNIFMLVSIWFLPKYFGIYALLIGYICVYGIDTLLNLRLIRKKTGVRLKVGGFAFYAVLFTVPTCVLGFLIKSLLLSRAGMFLTTFIGSIITVAFNFAFFIVFGLIDYREILSKLRKKTFFARKRNISHTISGKSN